MPDLWMFLWSKRGFIESVTKRKLGPSWQPDDVSDCIIALWKRWEPKAYDQSQRDARLGIAVSYWAVDAARSRFSTRNTARRSRHGSRNSEDALEDLGAQQMARLSVKDHEDAVIASIDLANMMRGMSDRHHVVYQMRMEGYTLAEVGDELGVGESRVAQILARHCKAKV